MKKSKFLIVPMIAFGMVSLAKAEPLVEESAIPGEFSANISLTSDYIFRGISQTGNNPAVQGGFDYTYDFGPAAVSAGIWASNVKFSDATIEIDYYAGVGGSIDNFSWDLSAIYYSYPGADSSLNYDFFEIAPSIGYDFGFMAVSAGLNYSPEYFGDSGDAYYTHGGIDIPLGKYFTLSGTVGYQAIDDNAAWGTDDYTDYGISLSTEIAGFGLSAGWTDTDLSKSQCDDACGVFSVALSRSF
ncbi:TorF family putative porin [uncultured Sneathiella sp.]|uniref:TorF family putative porin n=1 Tax=uncultured Sneathiella sp. TaxID=879315 RepID=UPI002592A106|nr:TorF family putative porin [uncultured Sneathiella sp.]